jgi:hypothetical protein
MSCTIVPSLSAETKIDILISNEGFNRYRNDYYGMNVCKEGYDFKYLMDMKFLLQMSGCAESECHCYCQCSYTAVKERINTL